MGPLAYLLTFRTYGTWLPGDPRGYNERRVPRLPPNEALHAWSRKAMVAPPFFLDAPARDLVESAIRHQSTHAGWTLHAVHVRTNHVHVVVSGSAPPERMIGQLKAWATRRLRDAARIGAEERPWAEQGSVRGLTSYEAVVAACRYVVEGQGAALR